MNKFSWAKALSFALVLWVVMFGLGMFTMYLGFTMGIWAMLIVGIIGATLAYFLTAQTNPDSVDQAFEYGLVFAAVGVILDILLSRLLVPEIFGVWTYWLGYLLIVAASTTAFASHQTTPHLHV